jgi:hypothetical protein
MKRELQALKKRLKELEARFERFREWTIKGPYGFNYKDLPKRAGKG